MASVWREMGIGDVLSVFLLISKTRARPINALASTHYSESHWNPRAFTLSLFRSSNKTAGEALVIFNPPL